MPDLSRSPFLRRASRWAVHRRGANLTTDFRFVNTCGAIFLLCGIFVSKIACPSSVPLAPCWRAANPTTDPRFVNPCEATFFCSAATFPLPLRSTPHRPPCEGPRILQPITGSSSPSRELFRRDAMPRPRRATQRPGARARTRACRPAAAVRRPRRRHVRDPRRPRRRYAPHAH